MNTKNFKRSIGSLAFSLAVGLLITHWSSEPARLKAEAATPAFIPQDDKSFNEAKKLDELRKQIAGKESQPAEAVFKNIQLLKGLPADRLLRVMEVGYSRSLGVNCTHCHIVDQWEREDKPTKQIARDMAGMVQVINKDLLKNIKNLKGPNPVVNCTSCHRGQTKPTLNLPKTQPTK